MKTCSKCHETKELTEFSKNPTKASPKNLYSQCRVCASKKGRKWYFKNKDHRNAAQRAWYENNKERHLANCEVWAANNRDKKVASYAKRRALKKNQTPDLTELEKAKIEHVYWMAQDCRAVSGETYHVDHIQPISKGGLHHPDNLQVMHWQDNLRKGAKCQ